MTRIVHITTAHPVRDNRIFRKECAALVEAGHEVTLVAVHPSNETIEGVHVEGLPRRKGRLARMTIGPWDAWRRLRSLRPAVIHGHDPELIPLLVAYRRANPSVRVIFDAHESLPKQVAGKPYLPPRLRPLVARVARGLEQLADRGLDGIVVATPHIAESFTNPNTTLVQNFPWLRDFPTPTEYPGHNHPIELSYVGAISRGRGSEVMGRLPRLMNEPAKVVAAGILASDAREEIENRERDGVEFRGKLAPEEVPALIAHSNVGLCLLQPLPNYLESQATKMYEYMAAARPFIASNFPYWISLFGPHDCGLFVDPQDEKAIAEAADRLARDPHEAAAMGRRGRHAIEAEFSFENEALRLVKLIDRLAPA